MDSSQIVQLMLDFRSRTQQIRGLPLPPNDDIGVSMTICDLGDTKIRVQVQGVPMNLPPIERLKQSLMAETPTHATAYFDSLNEAIGFLLDPEDEIDWILSDEELCE